MPGTPRRRARHVLIAAAVLGVVGLVAPAGVVGATVTLPTLGPTADGTRDAAIQVRGTTLAFDAIDEGIAGADTSTYLQNQQKTAGRAFVLLTDMPSDLTSLSSLTITIRARTVGVADDQTTLFAQLFAADETTALSSEALVATNPGTSAWATIANVAFSGLTSGSKAIWDSARLRLRWAYGQVGTADSTQLRLTAAELHGTYDSGGGPPPDLSPPNLTSAAVNGAALKLTYDEPLDAGSVPGPGAYAIVVDGNPRSVGGVAVGGPSVTLTLGSAVTSGQIVTASYSVPASNPVQDIAGNDAAAFSGRVVSNDTPGGGGGGGGAGGGGTLPTLGPTADGTRDAAIQVRGTTLAFDAIDEGIAGADTSTYLQNQQKTAGRAFVLLTDMPSDLTSLSSLTITIRARTVGVADDQTTLFAQLFAADETTALSSEALVATNPGTSAWATIANVAFSGLTSGSKAIWDSARLRLRWAYGQVGTADSTQLRLTAAELHGTYDSGGGPPPDLSPPNLTSAAVNGAALKLTYDEPLDAGSVPGPGAYAIVVDGNPRSVGGVAVGGPSVTLTLGSAVTSGQIVTASYSVPASNPVQDIAGNDAAAFTDMPVTNATPLPGGAVNASGNEITDAVRAASIQGDGRPPDSSVGIWEAAANLDSNGGFENGSSAGWTAAGGSIVAATDQAKFGSLSGKVVTSAPGDHVSKTIAGLSASTRYSRSLWIFRTETAATLTVSALDNAGTGILASAAVPAVLGWSRIVIHPQTQVGQTSLTTQISSTIGAITYFVDGAQLERNVVSTPYVETNGSTASRGPSKVSVVGSPVGPIQGWVAVRIRFGWDSTAPFSPDPGIVDMSVSNDDALFCYFDEASHTFHLERHTNAMGTHASSGVQAFSAGTVKTVIFAWTATDVRISVDGGPFVGTGNTTIPGQATLYIGSDQVQGNGSNRQADSDYLWVAGGSGTLSDADAATIHAFGDADHPIGDFPGSPTFDWSAS